MHSPLIRADWQAHPWLVHGFTTRHEGLGNFNAPNGTDRKSSRAGVNSLKNDQENRHRLITSVLSPEDRTERLRSPKLDDWTLVTLKQTHSAIVHSTASENFRQVEPKDEAYTVGDGLITDEVGTLLGIQTADCVPVLVADLRTRAVGAFHAGWRGTLSGIVDLGIRRMSADFGSDPEDLIAAIGPSIGPCCYTVGTEIRRAFMERFVDVGTFFHADEKNSGNSRLDLWEANRLQLIAAGVQPGRISVTAQCTACSYEPDGQRRFFSYRSEAGVTGRMMNIIGITEK